MHRISIALACLALLACASAPDPGPAGDSSNVTLLQPEVEIYQLVGPADLQYPTGRMEVQYGMRISNRSSEPLTLRRVQVESVGEGGPYRLRRETYYFRKELPGSQFTDVTFWAKAIAVGNAWAIDAKAPVTVRGIAYFESPTGNIRTVFVKNLGQTGPSSR